MIHSFTANVLPGMPGNLAQGINAVTTAHALIGAVGLLLGIYTVAQGNKIVPEKMRFKRNKIMMRISYSLYMLATLGGVVVYLLFYTSIF